MVIDIFKIDAVRILLGMSKSPSHEICVHKETGNDGSIGINPVFHKVDMVINLFLSRIVVLNALTDGSGDVVQLMRLLILASTVRNGIV